MKPCIRLYAALMMLAYAITGCGGGGASSSAPGTVVSGVASKGIFTSGTINVFAVGSDGKKGSQLAGPVAIATNGTYTADLGPYTGAVIIEASGTYTDEATNLPVTIPPAAPLHAMVPAVSNATNGAANPLKAAITPLTELAYRTAASNYTPSSMTAANAALSQLFKVSDIISVQPVDISRIASASQNQQAYTLALATLSQMATSATGATATDKLTSLMSQLTLNTAGELSQANQTGFSAALTTILNQRNLSAATYLGMLSGAGTKSYQVTLQLAGNLPSGTTIGALRGTISLPASATVRTTNTGALLDQLFTFSGTGANLTVQAGFNQGSISFGTFGETPLGQFTLTVESSAPLSTTSFSATLEKVTSFETLIDLKNVVSLSVSLVTPL